jgi:glycosyltransferase involved in cell wall biosynthesis
MPLVVHLIDFSVRNSWVEDQMDFFKNNWINQGLLTISSPGEIHEAALRKGIEKVQYVRHSVSGLFHACSLLKNWSKNEKVYVYAHGHLASIYASFIRSFTGIDFILCHHQQPDYFSHLRKRSLFRASIHLALARFYLIRARRIQSFSPEVTRSLSRKRINPNKIVEIPLGMNFGKFFEIDGKIKPEESSRVIKIVSVSRLVWEKRIDLGIRCVAHLLECGVLVDYSVVGEGPEHSNLVNLVNELGIDKYVKLLGRREDVNEILNSSNIFFHLSLTESYGQVLMEARLAGTPIFSSSCGVALEMEALKDPLVHVFHSSNPHIIADEFSLFLKMIETHPNLVTPNPELLYQGHEYNNVLKNVEKMFHELFESN